MSVKQTYRLESCVLLWAGPVSFGAARRLTAPAGLPGLPGAWEHDADCTQVNIATPIAAPPPCLRDTEADNII